MNADELALVLSSIEQADDVIFDTNSLLVQNEDDRLIGHILGIRAVVSSIKATLEKLVKGSR